MKLNKLLEKQIKKFLPEDLVGQESIRLFLNSINDSYTAYEKEIELSAHAFGIAEDEYREVNHQLTEQVKFKGRLINKLKEAVSEIGESTLMEQDDENEIINIATYLKQQIIKLKEADKRMQDQKSFYELILNNIPADIAVFDNQHRYMFVNPLGIKDAQLRKWIIGKNDEEYCAYKNRPQSVAMGRRKVFNETVASKRQKEWEEKSVGADGNAIYNLRKMYPVFNAEDQLEIVIGYGINITERKKIEEQIRLSEIRYRGIFDHSLALICTHDLDGTILDMNQSSLDTFMYSKEELTGSKLQQLIAEDKRDDFETEYLDVIKNEGKAEGIMVGLNKYGRKIFLLFHNYLVTNDTEAPYVIGFSQDITGRINAEKALKKSEEKYRNIIANMNLGLLEVDAGERIIYANNCFCEMSGYSPEELMGQDAADFFWHKEENIPIEDVKQRRANGSSDAYEIKTRNKNGEQKWWLISGAPTFDQSGQFAGSIGIHLDITLQKKLEHDLRKAKSDTELSAKAKEVFLANISHEIRTPMNAILGIAKLLEKTELAEKQKFYLNTIHHAANNLLVIINDLLDFSKIEAGKLTLEAIGFSMESTIKNTVQVLYHKAEEKGLLLSYDIDSGISPVLIGDPFRLNQVLMNFLSNSLKFTDNGHVQINCKLKSENNSTQEIEITVIDTGIGMSKEFMSNLFDKFSQEDESITRRFGGTGLGMGISQQIILFMGGSIKVDSNKNEGTSVSFVIRFPKGSADDLLQDDHAPIDTKVLTGKNILLVEDNEMNRLLANTILTQYGANVTEAENGNVAIGLIEEQAFDLILMDVQMPVRDGIDATRYIRTNLHSQLPIIALTANAYRNEEDRCLAAGMNGFISKPFEEQKFVQVVAEWLCREIPERDVVVSPAIAVPAIEDNSALFSLEKIIAISRGNEEFVNKMIGMFTTTMPDVIRQMQQAYSEQNWKAIAALAHRVKPSIQTMDITSITNDIAVLEEMKTKILEPGEVKSHLEHFALVIESVVMQLASR